MDIEVNVRCTYTFNFSVSLLSIIFIGETASAESRLTTAPPTLVQPTVGGCPVVDCPTARSDPVTLPTADCPLCVCPMVEQAVATECPSADVPSCPSIIECPAATAWAKTKIEIATLIYDTALPTVQSLFEKHGFTFDAEDLVRIRQFAILAANQSWSGQLAMFLTGFVTAFACMGTAKLVNWCLRKFCTETPTLPALPVTTSQSTGGTRVAVNDLVGIRSRRLDSVSAA